MKQKLLKAGLIPFLALFLSGSLFAQQGQEAQATKDVKVKVRTSDGNDVNITEDDLQVESNTTVEEILRQFNLMKELGELGEDEIIEINIKRSRSGEVRRNIFLNIDPKEEEEVMEVPAVPEPFFAPKPPVEVETNRPFLGVYFQQSFSTEKSEAANLERGRGNIITGIIPNTGAQEAGLKKEDIIVKVDGHDVSSETDLRDIVMANYKAGDVVKIFYVRNGRTNMTRATLGKNTGRNGSRNFHFNFENGSNDWPARIEKLKQMERGSDHPFLGVTGTHNWNWSGQATQPGARLTSIVPNSTAATMGLKVGDVIVKVNGEKVVNFEALRPILRNKKVGDQISVTYYRGEQSRTATGTLKSKGDTKGSHKEIEKIIEKLEIIETPETGQQNIFFPGDDESYYNARRSAPVVTREVNIRITVSDITSNEAEALSAATGEQFQVSNELEVESFRFFPNPTDGRFTVEFTLNDPTPAEMTIFNVDGKNVYEMTLDDPTAMNTLKIDLSNEPKGVYFMRILQGERTFTKKVITQ